MRSISDILKRQKEKEIRTLEPDVASEILASYGIKTPLCKVARTVDEAVEFVSEVGFPVAMKVVSQRVTHKSDVGGVALNVSSIEQVRDYFSSFQERASAVLGVGLDGVLIQEMAPPSGLELIVGGVVDPAFGPLVMFGLGGIYVEVMEDVAFGLAPLSLQEAQEMMREIRAYPILRGSRGRDPIQIESVANVLVGVSRLIDDEKDQIREIDINPLIAYKDGCVAVDARIIIGNR